MDVEIVTNDVFAANSYEKLFVEIMSDIGKAAMIEQARLVLDPVTPLFIFSVRLKSNPADKTIDDVAGVRTDEGRVHVTISDERYAPDVLSKLWSRYGRESVDQQTRFDLDVFGATDDDVRAIVVSSSQESTSEIVGALWRTMPEGIKNRHTFIDGPVITVVATEEIMKQPALDAGMEAHKRMVAGDV